MPTNSDLLISSSLSITRLSSSRLNSRALSSPLGVPNPSNPRRGPVAGAVAPVVEVLAVGVAAVVAEAAVLLAVVVVRRPSAERARRVAGDVAGALAEVARAGEVGVGDEGRGRGGGGEGADDGGYDAVREG